MHNDKVLEQLKFLAHVIDDPSDWKLVKKILIKSLPVELRSKFSRKDRGEKITEFEKDAIQKWSRLTGVEIDIQEDSDG